MEACKKVRKCPHLKKNRLNTSDYLPNLISKIKLSTDFELKTMFSVKIHDLWKTNNRI